MWRYIGLWVLLMCSQTVMAGRSCEPLQPNPALWYNASMMAYEVYQMLASSDAELAIVGRVGSDISDYGLKYTHAGIILRRHPKGRWLFTHVLNQCGTVRSALYDEGLINFFLDDPFKLDAIVVMPSKTLQQQMLRVLSMHNLHQPRYNMLAYPFSTRYQNSNGWILEIIAAAQMQAAKPSREAVQRFLAAQNFQPESIRLSPFKIMGAGLFRSNVHFDDHPVDNNNAYDIVSVRSLVRYLQQTDSPQIREFVLETTYH